ncbi:MAG: cell division protein FtsA [Spirochaetota bacterium]|nr:cell division protein FtsA [Spirochaetota bacterium]
MEHGVIAGLDIGTTKVSAVIGMLNEYGELTILGAGIAPSYGLRKGVIVNIDNTTESISKAIEDAELMAGVEVDAVYTSITGGHIRGQNSRGVIAVSSRNREVTDREVERVIEAAQAINIPSDKEVLHVIPWEFIVDEQDGVKDPVGMSGVRLEVDTHIVTGSHTAIQNITKSINKAGFNVQDFVLASLASAEAVLTEDEKEIGVLLVDIGGGTTDAILFVNGSIRYSSVFPVGGKHVTKDISVGLKVPDNIAEKVKLEDGCAISDLVEDHEEVEIPRLAGRDSRTIKKSLLCDIIEPRVEEILDLICQDAARKNVLGMAHGGVVLTGGAASLSGMADVAERVFNLPARVAIPDSSTGLRDKVASPIFSTAVGLVVHGLREENAEHYQDYEPKAGIFTRMRSSIRGFTKEFFA